MICFFHFRFGSRTDAPSLERKENQELITKQRLAFVSQEMLTSWQQHRLRITLFVRRICRPCLHKGPHLITGQEQGLSILLILTRFLLSTIFIKTRTTISYAWDLGLQWTISQLPRDVKIWVPTVVNTSMFSCKSSWACDPRRDYGDKC